MSNSQEENKITTVEKKNTKPKDPRKVELGKRLAKKLRLQQEEKKEILEYIDFKYVVGGVTVLGGLAGLYFTYKKNKREIKEEKFLEKNEYENMEKEKPVVRKEEKRKCDLDNL